jgi:type IV secretion system protein VirD4
MINWSFRVFRALGNMLGAAARDPLWAFMCIVMAPFRMWKHVLGTLVVVILSAIVLDLLFLWLESLVVPHGTRNKLLDTVLGIVWLLIIAGVFLRVIAQPLLNHFDYGGVANTHGSARFASQAEMDVVTRLRDGLLVGREGPGGKLMRYDGPAHLLTMAPTRSGKGVGTIIPNLLTQRRSIICIDPKGENARITARARSGFGPVHILDPFGITGRPSAAYNPLDGLDPQSPDIAEEAALLADALVYDEPGMAGEAHWNEEAKALVTGIILYIAETEPRSRRNLSTLREYLTLAPDTFLGLLEAMQTITACHGLIQRAANRHLGKSDREAAGVLSSAQRHTHFLDSPRMGQVLERSDFNFRDLKRTTGTVFLVLPPDRLSTYARWLRLLITQSLNDMAQARGHGPFPVLYLLDEFASLGYLASIERAMGLMAGYGVQLWPILQDIHQLKAIYGKKAGTFLSNAGVLQVFGVNDHESAKLVSDLLGQQTVVFQTMGRNLDSEQSGISYGQHHTGRPLMTPDEVRTMPEHVELLFIAQQKPVAAVKLRYFEDPEFKGSFDRI